MKQVQDPQATNDLLKEIVTALLDQAHGEFEDRSGKKLPLGRLQKLKLDAAGKIAGLGMKQLARNGDPQQQLDRLAGVTNQYLPGLLDVVGEEAVRARLDKLPARLRSQEVIRELDQAGAHELARLLNGGKPIAKEEAEPPPPPPPPAAAAPAAASLSERFGAAPPKKASPPPPLTEGPAADRLALLKSQLALMETMHRHIAEAIPRLRQAIAEEEHR